MAVARPMPYSKLLNINKLRNAAHKHETEKRQDLSNWLIIDDKNVGQSFNHEIIKTWYERTGHNIFQNS